MDDKERQEDLGISVYNITENGEVFLIFSQPILLLPETDSFVPSNKISSIDLASWNETI
jgi:hypothetical protein